MRTHPPIFNRLTTRLETRHPVNVLARRLAHQERPMSFDIAISRIWDYQRSPSFNNYRPDERE